MQDAYSMDDARFYKRYALFTGVTDSILIRLLSNSRLARKPMLFDYLPQYGCRRLRFWVEKRSG